MKYYLLILFFFFPPVIRASSIRSIPEGTTEFVVKKNYNLRGRELVIPDGCKLIFKGGSFRNGTLLGYNSNIETPQNRCIFRDCSIEGSWNVEVADSRMFEKGQNTNILLLNLARLSRSIILHNDREYVISKQILLENIEELQSGNEGRSVIKFITDDPNKDVLIFKGDSVLISDIDFVSDYELRLDELMIKNKPTVGNLLSLRHSGRNKSTFKIVGCTFSGGTPSSYIASSTASRCEVRDCYFSGYMADHAVYCSMSIDYFAILNCTAEDVPHTNALYKVRASPNLQNVRLSNLICKNVNGYLGQFSLMNNAQTQIELDGVQTSKDSNNYIMYGVCVNCDPSADSDLYNAESITVKNSYIGYGYQGNSFLYRGGGVSGRIRSITYDNVDSYGTGFSGCVIDTLTVRNSTFHIGKTRVGNAMDCKHFVMENTKIQQVGSLGKLEAIFLFNFGATGIESVLINNSKIETTAKHLIKYNKAIKHTNIRIQNSEIKDIEANLVSAPDSQKLNYISKGNSF